MKLNMGPQVAVLSVIILLLSSWGCVCAETYSTYTDAKAGYQFAYPTAWVPVHSPSVDVGFGRPLSGPADKGLVLFTVVSRPTDMALQQYHNASLQQLYQSLNNKAVATKLVELGGYPAHQMIFSNMVGNTEVRMQTVYTILDGHLYMVVLQATAADFDQMPGHFRPRARFLCAIGR